MLINQIACFESNCLLEQFIEFLYVSGDLVVEIACIVIKAWVLAQTMVTMITVDGLETSCSLSEADNWIN